MRAEILTFQARPARATVPSRISEQARRLVVAGGSGFLGRALAQYFSRQSWDVVIVSRSRPGQGGPARWVSWDGLRQGDWTRELDGAAAVVNLAGRTVNYRYTAQNMLNIYTSRPGSTRALGHAIRATAKSEGSAGSRVRGLL